MTGFNVSSYQVDQDGSLIASTACPVDLDTTILVHRELHAGEVIDVASELIWCDGKTVRVVRELRRGGELVADLTSIGELSDLEERRPVSA